MSAIGDTVLQYPESGSSQGMVFRMVEQAANATVSSAPIPGLPTPFIAPNANRLGLIVANDTANDVYLQFHDPKDYGFGLKIKSGSFYELKGHQVNRPVSAWAPGASWTSGSPNNPNYITALWGFSSSSVLAGDASGSLWYWNGTTWSNSVLPGSSTAVSGARINAIWGVSTTDLWATTSNGIFSHLSGGEYITYSVPGWNPFTLWGSATNDVWFPKNGSSFEHWDGNALANVVPTGSTGCAIVSVWGFSQNNVWAVGNYNSGVLTGSIWHFDGAHWNLYTTVTSSTNATLPQGEYFVQGIWGANPNDIWAAGPGGALYHYTGSTGVWSPVFFTDAITQQGFLFGSQIFGSGPSDVWFPIGSGTLAFTLPMWAHWNGTAIFTGTVPGYDTLATVAESKVWASGQNDVYMGSTKQPLIHWAGVSGSLLVTEIS